MGAFAVKNIEISRENQIPLLQLVSLAEKCTTQPLSSNGRLLHGHMRGDEL